MLLRLAFVVLVGSAPSALRSEDCASRLTKANLTGRGITVAILDSGFRGYREHLGKELPTSVKAKSFRTDGNLEAKDSSHGTVCAEIIHAVAPDANLVFANWEPDQPGSFLQAAKWAREQGATILCCSIVMPGWSDGLGGGEAHRELERLLGDSLFFASAGNLAERHWSGAFQERGRVSAPWTGIAISRGAYATPLHGSGALHEWQTGRTENVVNPWGGQPVSVELTSRDATTYRILLIDSLGKSVAMEQPLAGRGLNGSAVRFMPKIGETYRVQVELVSERGGEFRLLVLGGELEIATANGCMVFPGDGKNVVAVGAVSAEGERIRYSSTGSTGARVKPDCVAPVPFVSAIRRAPFGGTSAAAPQAAGLAALMWSRDPQTKSAAIREMLWKNCTDLGIPGPDAETGYGMIRLPLLVPARQGPAKE